MRTHIDTAGTGRIKTATRQAVLALLLAVATLGGCQAKPKLPPTPNLYVQREPRALAKTELARQSVDAELIYATDRMRVDEERPKVRYYSERRSDSLYIGQATMRFGGEGQTWDDLFEASLDPEAKRLPVTIVDVQETIVFPSSIVRPVRIDGEVRDDPAATEARELAEEALHQELSRRLAPAARKDVFLYVHGVGNSFEDPLYRMAELWHFLGRPGVPIVYTWPAIKGGGPLRGYTYARESSEFTVYHLRQLIQAVASCPDVQRINILAHSRGTDITISALRDLRLIYHDDPQQGRDDLKISQVILAAPDIDLEVARQRFRPDKVHEIIDRLTIYVSPRDKALGIAEYLFRSGNRLGAVTEEGMTDEGAAILREDLLRIDFIDVKVKKRGAHGHTYWIDNPAVLSDVILLFRDGRKPGAEHGRPLIRSDLAFWQLYDGYPLGGPHAELADSIPYE